VGPRSQREEGGRAARGRLRAELSELGREWPTREKEEGKGAGPRGLGLGKRRRERGFGLVGASFPFPFSFFSSTNYSKSN
jgi:hypothetical protein